MSVDPARTPYHRASLLQVIYSVRGKRLLMGKLSYNLLFSWFMGAYIDALAWGHSTFSFNRQRLVDEGIVHHFFGHTMNRPGFGGGSHS